MSLVLVNVNVVIQIGFGYLRRPRTMFEHRGWRCFQCSFISCLITHLNHTDVYRLRRKHRTLTHLL